LRASAVVVNTGVSKKDGDFWLGTETATLDFGDGDTLQLITTFVTDHMLNPSGVFRVTEVGIIANGTGRFTYANGVFFTPGSFGPGLSPDGQTMLWTGEYQGIVCGVDAGKLGEKVKKNAVTRARSTAAKAER
jgi:sugar lactone lactonase YvrE